MKPIRKARFSLITAMLIFGSIGIFRKFIPLPSAMIAAFRGLIGMLFLLILMWIKKEKVRGEAIKMNFIWLSLSGILIGFNWVLLFEAYRYTSVATATLCYYMAPLFVMLVAPILLRERLTLQKGICMGIAFVGMILVSGILDVGVQDIAELRGILLGLGAALLYASVVLINQRIKNISALVKTAVQLGFAAFAVLPYSLFAEQIEQTPTLPVILLLLVVGIVHTGMAYALYFSSMTHLRAQTVALFSYLDPIVAILLSLIVLGEPMSPAAMIGAVLILGSTMVSELRAS